ncbi:LON peptidase substrate-binding domain-containing protein [Janibacter hoylei]|uniref:LON peptidase substrate-binding domain-containing protein n=1 Tax=Janibacter hoylei TaxID=364298 RepID=UPI0024935261|nr:LON peptidase substrate-binding domain-containing protein [Janibacter hoylei]
MDVLPMFPLGTVLLPGQPLPLQVFEPRYLTMLRDVADGDGRFGVVLIERGFEVGGGDQRFAIGCVASIEQVRPMGGGRVGLLARGQERIEVVGWLPDDPYPRAEVRRLPDLAWADDDAPRLAETERTVRRALTVMSEYRSPALPADIELADDPVARSWQLAWVAQLGALDQLALLRSSSLGELLETTTRLTSEALELLPLQSPDEPD